MSADGRWRRLLSLPRRNLRKGVDDELAFHLEMKTRELIASGMDPRAARTAAEELFGAVPPVRDACLEIDERKQRRNRREDYMTGIAQDVRFALRTLGKRPAFTAVAVLTLALGIGATTAIYSVVDAVLIRPLPFPDAERVSFLWASLGPGQRNMAQYADLMVLRERARSFETIGVMRGMSVNLTGGETPDRLTGMFASAEALAIIGQRTAIGRTFTAEEATPRAGARVAVLSYGAWQSRFGGDRHLLGRSIVLNGQPHTVIGVMGPDPYPPMASTDVWLPISSVPWQATFDRGNPNVWGIARLKPGVSLEKAQRELDVIAADIAREFPASNRGVGLSAIAARDQFVGPLRRSLLTIFAAVGLLLLIACANVANLQLARATARTHEIALRSALGAGRGRIVRQLLTESLVLALFGGTLGVLLAQLAVRGVMLVPGGVPAVGDVGVNGSALAFALAATLFCALLFGLAPALRSSRRDLRSSFGTRVSSGSGGGRARGGAVITMAQLALCTALLIVAGLLTRSLQRLRAVDPGFDASGLLGAEFRLPLAKYGEEPARAEFFRRALGELRSMPGASSAALASTLPLSGNYGLSSYEVPGEAADAQDPQRRAYSGLASDGYFSTMHIPLLAGRDFSPDDRIGTTRVVVVSQTLAKRAWPTESPLGKSIRLRGDSVWATVIGVVADIRELSLAEPPGARFYAALMQDPGIFASVAVRTNGDPAQSTDALRRAIWAVDRDQPVWRIRPVSEFLASATSQQRFTAGLTLGFALLALLLGAIGVYGVMSHAVAQRTREMGVRIALGATGRGVVRMVVGQVARLSAVGVGVGVVLAAFLARMLGTQLYGVPAHDPVTFVSVPLLLLGVALLATYAPARRAGRVDPMVALRSD